MFNSYNNNFTVFNFIPKFNFNSNQYKHIYTYIYIVTQLQGYNICTGQN